MKYKTLPLLTLAAAASLCAFSVAANAQVSRLYFAGYLGLSTFNDQPFSETTTNTSGDIKLDNATSFAGALGLRLSRDTRLEAEISYRKADISGADVGGSGTLDMGGNISSKFGFISLYQDFNNPRWKVKPYIGGGLGLVFHDASIVDPSGVALTTSDSSTGFAYHLGAGVKYRMSPDLAVTTGYRYIGTGDMDIASYQIDYSSHEFRMGLEWDLPYRTGSSSRSRY